MNEELENDIRELRGANPGELALRLVEKGWTKVDAGELREEILTVLIQNSRQGLEPGELAERITARLRDKGII